MDSIAMSLEDTAGEDDGCRDGLLYLVLLWRRYASIRRGGGGGGEGGDGGGGGGAAEEDQELTANEFVDAICAMWGPSSEWARYAEAVDGEPGEELRELIPALARLMIDAERRAALMLAFLRKFPMMVTPCFCEAPMCFKCKTEGHHGPSDSNYEEKVMTCAEMAKAEAEIDAQFCPACGVATVRSEGCNHIICVCGHNWTWEGDSDEEY